MTATEFDTERIYDDDRFSTVEVFRSDRMRVICGRFEPGQFIRVHAPSGDVEMHIRSGTGFVREGDAERSVESGDVIVVEADTDRGIEAESDSRLEASLVTAPPPTDAEHESVRKGLQQNDFDHTTYDNDSDA